MTSLNQVYKCSICGNIVEVVHTGAGELVCCGQPMDLLDEKSKDEGLEKHVPVVEKIDGGVRVKVGSVAHPMEGDHYIEWIEIVVGDQVYRKYLSPGDEPVAEFCIAADGIVARIHCNVHGLWVSE